MRNDYHINDIEPTTVDLDDNVPIFNLNSFQFGDLSGGAPLQGPAADAAGNCEGADESTELCELPTDHQIEWKYFVPALNAQETATLANCVKLAGLIVAGHCEDPGINFARQTQPTISTALFNLPADAIAGCPDEASSVCNGSADLISRDFASTTKQLAEVACAVATPAPCRRVAGCASNLPQTPP